LEIDGKAVATFPNSDTYAGEYKEAKKNGKGTYTWESGSKYEGDYVDGMRTGQGTMTYEDGSKYVGEWKDNQHNGQGTYFYPNGDRYSGDWVMGIKNGTGIYMYAQDKAQLDGTWENGVCTTGSLTYHDNSKFIGNFKNNQPCGRGEFVFRNGLRQHGVYSNGQFQPIST
jgi:hypothetical protein